MTTAEESVEIPSGEMNSPDSNIVVTRSMTKKGYTEEDVALYNKMFTEGPPADEMLANSGHGNVA